MMIRGHPSEIQCFDDVMEALCMDSVQRCEAPV